ncbi:MAG: hypothetical protein HPY64_03615 [Anaerolineae bacterium]|nr:hypothetical protein [Anaerolineae bacterium]
MRATGRAWWENLLLALILLLGAGLRVSGLAPMSDMLHYDEAYNGLDALSLLARPRLQVFFPGNYGREGLWIYALTPGLAIFGSTPFALRLTAIFTGILCVAAVGALARRLLGRAAVLWTAGALAGLYWHVHASHLALRASLYLLVGALALTLLLRAAHLDRRRAWLLAGVALGLLVYTYFAAWLWLACCVLTALIWASRHPAQRAGLVAAGGAAGLVALPLGLTILRQPGAFIHRAGDVAQLDLAGIAANALAWLRAWLAQGDTNALFNLPGRPILDTAGLALTLIGLGALLIPPARRPVGLWLFALVAASIAPSLFSLYAPHFLRALGTVIPLALVMGAGGAALACWSRAGRMIRLLPVGLLVVMATRTAADFQTWLARPETFIFMEQPIARSAAVIAAAAAPEMPVYFSPLADDHPVLRFRAAQLLDPRPVSGFNSHACLVLADVPAVYASLTLYEPEFAARLGRWMQVEPLAVDAGAEPPRYTVFQVTPEGDPLPDGAPIFGGAVVLASVGPLPSHMLPGETLPVSLALRALRPLEEPYRVFVHLYGDPTPYEGGRLWAQQDTLPCGKAYPPMRWRVGETIIQSFTLDIPADTPPGVYTVAVGVYGGPEDARLPLDDRSGNWATVGTLHVGSGDKPSLSPVPG